MAVRTLARAPEELTRGRLRRLGEGIGKVVYASPHWVVKRERSPSEILALVTIWRVVRKLEKILPGNLGRNLLYHPSRQLRFLRVVVQGVVRVLPQSVWYSTHVGEMWRLYRHRDVRGEELAKEYLAGSDVVPERVSFPPVRVEIGGWPGWLTVSEATERVEATLYQKVSDLAGEGRFEEVELWLERLLDLRKRGWRRGVFSVDAHLKNFGVTGERVVLLDPGGLTDQWDEIERRLAAEERIAEPHAGLGLGPVLESRPDIAERFNELWKATVNRDEVSRHLTQS